MIFYSKLIIYGSLFVIPWNAFSKTTVTKMVGRAVYINDNGKKEQLKINDHLDGDGLLATANKSFIKVTFDDGASISLGPNSQGRLAQKMPNKPKVVELLQGQLRAMADEKKPVPPEGHKLYIKTRSSSMGVRGTDFLVVHNPKNHVTATVTFKGEVQIFKKKDEDIHESLREEFDRRGKSQKTQQSRDIQNMEDELHHHTVESVAPGTLSGAYPSYEKAQAAIKISPAQLQALQRNNDLSLGVKGKLIKGTKLVQNSNIKNNPHNSDLLPTPPGDRLMVEEGELNSKSAEGVRSGGVLDLNTGLYLAPPEGSVFDNKTGTYVLPEDYGAINEATGEYVPPMGLKLDPLHGFIGMGPEQKDRNVSESLKKLSALTGDFNQRLSKTLSIFKEISRVDLLGYLNYRFTTNSMENYYGEWRSITNQESMILDWKIHSGFQLFHTQNWLLYPKFHFYTIYHERDTQAIKRNDSMEVMLGWETHYKHYLFGKKARLVADAQFRTVYLDYKRRQQYDYYTEDTGLKISERFQFNRHHLSEPYYQIRAFQSYHDPNHGNIHNLGYTHRFFLGKFIDLQINYEHSVRKEQWTANRFKIDRLKGELILHDFFYRTDVTTGYTWEWHYYQFEPQSLAAYQSDPFRLNENMKNGFFYRAHLLLQKRMGNFWKLNGLYEYSRQRTGAGGVNRAFIQQTWGGGLTMVF